MKMDKETLVKHRFWIGMIAFGPLWLIILIVALVSSGSEAATKAKEIADAKTKVNGITGPKNESYTNLVHEKQLALEKQKDKVWAEAWKGQQTLMTWPNGMDGKADLEQHGYFGQALTAPQHSQFRDPKNYAAQLPVGDPAKKEWGVRTWLAPNGEIEADWDRLIHKADFNRADAKDPTDEECWLAQEDVWVQQEMLAIVRSALDSAMRFENVAHFKAVEIPKAELDKLNAAAAPAPAPGGAATGPATPPAGGAAESAKKQPVLVRQRFHTPHWKLDLVMEENEKHELTVSTQTALSALDAGAKLPSPGLDVQLWQNSNRQPQPQTLHFEGGKAGEPLPLAKAVPLPGFATNFDDLPLEVNITLDKSEPPTPEGTRRFVYRNPGWELELLVTQKPGEEAVISPDSKLKNIDSTHRTLSLAAAQFVVYQGDKWLAQIFPPGDWLGWNSTINIQKASDKPIRIAYDAREKAPLGVIQQFNPYTSPIARIESFEIPGAPECTAYNSCRTSNLVMKPAAQFPVEEKKDDKASGTGGAGGGLMGMAGAGGGMMGMSGGAPRPGAGPGAPGADSSLTPNGLNRNRYIAVTEQVRHMPIAMSMIVEQSHLQDLLTAVANSKLRIQITQVQWKRAEGLKRGTTVAAAPATGPATGPVTGGAGGVPAPIKPLSPGTGGGDTRLGGGPPMMGGRGGISGSSPFGSGLSYPGLGSSGRIPTYGGMPGGLTGGYPGLPGSASASGDESDPNLIEVAVYGIAALYERYPPKAKTEGGAGGTPTPAPGAANPQPPK